jgi:uncharacterized protein (DUF302 family)
MAGAEDLMLFQVLDHGGLMVLYGKARKAKQYVLGNPLTASQMTRHDIRAGLYAPLRLLVFEAEDGSLSVEYDLPSSLFGQFKNEAVTEVARGLDVKVDRLIEKASRKP